MFCKGSLGKVDAKDLELFRNRLVHEFLLLESVDYSGTSEYLSGHRKRRILMSKTSINGADGKANWSGAVNFHSMQMSLVMSVWFIFSNDRNVVPCSSCFFFALWQ